MSEPTLLEKPKTAEGDIVEQFSEKTEKDSSPAPKFERPQRNYGVELLRILSMIFIIMLHVINFGGAYYYHSGVYFPVDVGNLDHYKVMNIMLAFCYCAVNCYALISGYVGCKSKFKVSKLVSLWLTVVSINAAIYLITYFVNPEIAALYDIKRIFTPIISDQYWYFTAYMGLLVIMPALNAAVNNIPKKQYQFMLVGMLVLFVAIPVSQNKDLFYTHTGYSMLWLMFMYFVGAYFKLHFNPKKKLWLIRVFSALVYVASCLALAFVRFHDEKAGFDAGNGYVLHADGYQYTSLYVLCASVALFVLFININIKNRIAGKIIGFVSGTTFGIYLIHLNYIVVDHLITGRFVDGALKAPHIMAFGIFVAAVAVFAVCAAFEKVRQLLFRILYIDKLVSLLDKIKLSDK